jgi:hypothetical protein
MFLIPPIVCVVSVAALWWADLLPHREVVLALMSIGLIGQFLAPTSSVWLAALLWNVVLAIYLVIRIKLKW